MSEQSVTSYPRAILAGGCFWGMQDIMDQLPGVVESRVGYTGGQIPDATYDHHEGHAEAVELWYDPQVVTYRQILEYFFCVHDPTTFHQQGNRVGESYRSEIFVLTPEQERIAYEVREAVKKSRRWPGAIMTRISPAGPFWVAEPEHQHYLRRVPDGYTYHHRRPHWRITPEDYSL